MSTTTIDSISTGTLKQRLASLSDKRAVNGYLDSDDASRLYSYERELRRRNKRRARA